MIYQVDLGGSCMVEADSEDEAREKVAAERISFYVGDELVELRIDMVSEAVQQ